MLCVFRFSNDWYDRRQVNHRIWKWAGRRSSRCLNAIGKTKWKINQKKTANFRQAKWNVRSMEPNIGHSIARITTSDMGFHWCANDDILHVRTMVVANGFRYAGPSTFLLFVLQAKHSFFLFFAPLRSFRFGWSPSHCSRPHHVFTRHGFKH